MADLYLANTDNDWFDFLRERSPLEDVNFWKPSPNVFRALDEGELFVFRLKSPRNVIGGYGVLASSLTVSIQLAWDSLGERNGSPSLEHMVRAIRRYRQDSSINPQSLIGSRVLVSPVFLHPSEWFSVPSDWSSNIVTGKLYSTDSDHGAALLRQLELRTRPDVLFDRTRRQFEGDGFSEMPQARYGTATAVAPRLGQGAFRLMIASAYGFQCALSDTRVLPALEAAHIRPYAQGGPHELTNGVFLRKDIHSVFDSGFATLTDDLRFHVSRTISDVFNNGNEYKRLHGMQIRLPANPNNKPSLEAVRWHQTERFVGD